MTLIIYYQAKFCRRPKNHAACLSLAWLSHQHLTRTLSPALALILTNEPSRGGYQAQQYSSGAGVTQPAAQTRRPSFHERRRCGPEARRAAAASRQLCVAVAGTRGRPVRHGPWDSPGPSAFVGLTCHWKRKLKRALPDGFLPIRRCGQSEREGKQAVVRILCLCWMKEPTSDKLKQIWRNN